MSNTMKALRNAIIADTLEDILITCDIVLTEYPQADEVRRVIFQWLFWEIKVREYFTAHQEFEAGSGI
jgi:hypothetical protein